MYQLAIKLVLSAIGAALTVDMVYQLPFELGLSANDCWLYCSYYW